MNMSWVLVLIKERGLQARLLKVSPHQGTFIKWTEIYAQGIKQRYRSPKSVKVWWLLEAPGAATISLPVVLCSCKEGTAGVAPTHSRIQAHPLKKVQVRETQSQGDHRQAQPLWRPDTCICHPCWNWKPESFKEEVGLGVSKSKIKECLNVSCGNVQVETLLESFACKTMSKPEMLLWTNEICTYQKPDRSKMSSWQKVCLANHYNRSW